jgi:MFS family permease
MRRLPRQGVGGVQQRVLEARIPRPWGLAAYWFSLSFQGAALMAIVVPRTLARLSPATRTAELARIAALASVVAMVVPPVVGAVSDRVRRQTRRLPFVMYGTVLNVAGLAWAMEAQGVGGLTAGLLVAVTGQGAALAGYEAMLPEVVHPSRWGQASGHMGVASLAGSVAGLATAGAAPLATAYWAMILTAGLGAVVTAAAVAEPAVVEGERRAGPVVRDRARFRWVFAGRFCVLFGQTLLMTFVLYFFEDVLGVAAPAAGTALVAGLALVGAAGSGVYAGQASDGRDRAHLVALAGIPMTVAVAGFALVPRAGLIFALAALWGLGYGAFQAVDWALALDVVPDLRNVARDLGIWGIAGNLPAVLAPLAGGFVLARAPSAAAGYRALFLVAAGAFALGSLLVEASRQTARLGRGLRLLFMLAVATLLRAYVAVAYEVRVVGRLPRDRAGLLVLANHQHDLDGMVIPARLFLADPWRGPVRSAASPRVLEPGFLSGRGPRWLGRLLGGVGLGPVLAALGVLPIEDMPLVRPLASWAYEVYARHGDLPAAEVVAPAVLEGLPPPAPRRLSDLWRRGRSPQAAARVSIRALRDPYRAELRDGMRRRIEAQLAALAGVLDAGETLYLTPEGRMTATGGMGRLRAAMEVVGPHARGVYLAAVSYDPWSGRRLRMLTRLLPPADPARPGLSLAAARPVLLSQVMAAALLASRDGATVAELADAVRAARSSGAHAVLPARPEAAVRAALGRMARRGAARRQGDRWLPGSRRHDPRFPHVPDLLAAQAQQYEETLAACRELGGRGGAGT